MEPKEQEIQIPEEPTEMPTEAVVETPKINNSPIIKVKLTGKQEEKVVQLIEKEMSKIIETYETYNRSEGWFNHVDKTTQDYIDGGDVEDFDEDNDKKRLLLTTMMCDVIASKDKRQTMGAKPVILMVPKRGDEEKYEAGDLSDWQDDLDNTLRKDCKLEELKYVSSRMACANGVAIDKYPYEKNIEYKTRRTLYKPADKAKFESLYASDLVNPESKAFKNWEKLQSGQEVVIDDVEPIVQFHGVKPYRVDLKKFYARLDIKDFRRHKVISELIDTYTWADIEARTAQDENDSHGYDPDAVARLKEKLGDKFADSKNTIYESIVNIKLESEVKEGEEQPKDRYQRYLVTYEDAFKIVLKCIHDPYEHNDICYVAKCAIPDDKSWAGYSFSTRIRDVKKLAEGFLNSILTQFKLSENGMILTDDDKTDFSRMNITNGDGMSVVKFSSGKQFSQFRWDFPNVDRAGLINWVFNFGSLITGVDPAINSGAQSPDDPRAPLGKALVKQANSDKRIEDIILNLQKADELGARMVDWTYNQFVAKEEDRRPYFDGDYVCHGSTLSFSPEMDNQVILGFVEAVGKMSPQTIQDTNVVYTLISALINNAGGSIKKNKDIILNPLKKQVDLEKGMIAAIKEIQEEGQRQGKTRQEIQIAIQKVMGAMKGEQPGAPGQVPADAPPMGGMPQ
jgi:hypothetical protein